MDPLESTPERLIQDGWHKIAEHTISQGPQAFTQLTFERKLSSSQRFGLAVRNVALALLLGIPFAFQSYRKSWQEIWAGKQMVIINKPIASSTPQATDSVAQGRLSPKPPAPV